MAASKKTRTRTPVARAKTLTRKPATDVAPAGREPTSGSSDATDVDAEPDDVATGTWVPVAKLVDVDAVQREPVVVEVEEPPMGAGDAQVGAPEPQSVAATVEEAARPTPTQAAPAVVAEVMATPPAQIVPAPAPMPTWGSAIEWVNPDTLSDHALWCEILGAEPREREEELATDVRDNHIARIITVTGDGCASPRDTILDGHRYRYAAVAARLRIVGIIRRCDLSADAEELLIISAAISSQHIRRLRPSKLAALEARLHQIYARRSGHRSDLATSVDPNGGPVGDTLDLVAREARQARNAVANRRKTFYSPVTTLALTEAVDGENVSLSAAADIIRKAEAEPEVATVLTQAKDEAWAEDSISQHAKIQDARRRVEQAVRERLGKPTKVADKPKPSKPDKPEAATFEAPGRMEGETLVLECLYRNRRTRISVMGRVIRVEDLGGEGRKAKKAAG